MRSKAQGEAGSHWAGVRSPGHKQRPSEGVRRWIHGNQFQTFYVQTQFSKNLTAWENVGRGCSVLRGLHSHFLLHNHPSFNPHKSYLSPNCNLTKDHKIRGGPNYGCQGSPLDQGTINPGQGFVPFLVLNVFLFRGNLTLEKKKVFWQVMRCCEFLFT